MVYEVMLLHKKPFLIPKSTFEYSDLHFPQCSTQTVIGHGQGFGLPINFNECLTVLNILKE